MGTIDEVFQRIQGGIKKSGTMIHLKSNEEIKKMRSAAQIVVEALNTLKGIVQSPECHSLGS